MPTLSIGDVTQEEGNGGTANPTAFTFTLTLSADAAGDVTVNYAARDGAANMELTTILMHAREA